MYEEAFLFCPFLLSIEINIQVQINLIVYQVISAYVLFPSTKFVHYEDIKYTKILDADKESTFSMKRSLYSTNTKTAFKNPIFSSFVFIYCYP